jgi:hypothetical protein
VNLTPEHRWSCPNCTTYAVLQLGHVELYGLRRSDRSSSHTRPEAHSLSGVQETTSARLGEPVASGQSREGAQAQEAEATKEGPDLYRLWCGVPAARSIWSTTDLVPGVPGGCYEASQPTAQSCPESAQVRHHTGTVRSGTRCAAGRLRDLWYRQLGCQGSARRSLSRDGCGSGHLVWRLQWRDGAVSR